MFMLVELTLLLPDAAVLAAVVDFLYAMLRNVALTDEAVAEQLYVELATPVLHLVGPAGLYACRSVQAEAALFCWGSFTVRQFS